MQNAKEATDSKKRRKIDQRNVSDDVPFPVHVRIGKALELELELELDIKQNF